MRLTRLLILSAMTACVLALTGCSDRTKDPGADRSDQNAEQLRHRVVRTQADR